MISHNKNLRILQNQQAILDFAKLHPERTLPTSSFLNKKVEINQRYINKLGTK